jgi:glycosyltransferase involved in cell wall biosynthesis
VRAVAVVTRTKDRPHLLGRAQRSVAGQNYRDLVWVLVNDGGARGPVDEIVERARRDGLEVVVVHRAESAGMEAASNAGLAAAPPSEYVVIHDDDDSWEPRFLEATVGLLEARGRAAATQGAVAHALRVFERLDGERVEVLRSVPHSPELKQISLFQMARLDVVPPPISFLYRRSVLDVIGSYREDLPVLGDWEFNLRFLRRFDIEVVPEQLANYHLRQAPDSGVYGNTVTMQLPLHGQVANRLRNELLRQDLDAGIVGMGWVVNAAHELKQLENGLRLPVQLRRMVRAVGRLFRSRDSRPLGGGARG